MKNGQTVKMFAMLINNHLTLTDATELMELVISYSHSIDTLSLHRCFRCDIDGDGLWVVEFCLVELVRLGLPERK